jgi:hypothetical protein
VLEEGFIDYVDCSFSLLVTDKGPHIVGHLGMTGWVYVSANIGVDEMCIA